VYKAIYKGVALVAVKKLIVTQNDDLDEVYKALCKELEILTYILQIDLFVHLFDCFLID
jgi:hypothetical protein